jgi:hypothetical protein
MAETKAAPATVKLPVTPGNGVSSPETATPIGTSLRKKQKRNKPTLSCEECVERKTKVSRLPAIDPLHRAHVRVRAWLVWIWIHGLR